MDDFSEDELQTLKKMIAREEAVTWMWGWVRNVLFVIAGGLLALSALYDYLRK